MIVERYIAGHDFRLLVVGKQLVAAARRDPPQVTGDGVHTVRQLVDEVNRDPRRGDGHATSLTKIRFDEIALATLAKQGLTADAVPANGARVILRNNANLSTGGTATDVTDDVHPELAASAVAAAQMVGLDICGVDAVCETVLKPFEEQAGGIVEVNDLSTRPRACACICSPPTARAARSAKRLSRPCSPTATMAAFPWSRCPAPTARPPRYG